MTSSLSRRLDALERVLPPRLSDAERDRLLGELLAYAGDDPDVLRRRGRVIDILATVHGRMIADGKAPADGPGARLLARLGRGVPS